MGKETGYFVYIMDTSIGRFYAVGIRANNGKVVKVADRRSPVEAYAEAARRNVERAKEILRG